MICLRFKKKLSSENVMYVYQTTWCGKIVSIIPWSFWMNLHIKPNNIEECIDCIYHIEWIGNIRGKNNKTDCCKVVCAGGTLTTVTTTKNFSCSVNPQVQFFNNLEASMDLQITTSCRWFSQHPGETIQWQNVRSLSSSQSSSKCFSFRSFHCTAHLDGTGNICSN